METAQKVNLFRRYFSGLPYAYGTYDPVSKVCRVVKLPVTDQVILDHLEGRNPYGVYLLVNDRTRAVAVDFDQPDSGPPVQFVYQAAHYRLPAYIERSKSKGYHAWIFFEETGILAAQARLVVQHLLCEIQAPASEIFPKHDRLDPHTPYGNFINAPLFGALVPQGKTVFVDPASSLQPYPDQWEFLQTIQVVTEDLLNEIITINDWFPRQLPDPSPKTGTPERIPGSFGLPPCAQRILRAGVSRYQRVVCFRLAVHCKRLGIPYDLALVLLRQWARKNHPLEGKPLIQEKEIETQTAAAYRNAYRGCGCDDPTILPFCDDQCPIHRMKSGTPDSLYSIEKRGPAS